jgi:hypothetical protein
MNWNKNSHHCQYTQKTRPSHLTYWARKLSYLPDIPMDRKKSNIRAAILGVILLGFLAALILGYDFISTLVH